MSPDWVFRFNVGAEIGDEFDKDVQNAVLDMLKCYETVQVDALTIEAVPTGFPLRLAWTSVRTYAQPRLVKVYGSLSYAVVSLQGILVGCSMAATMLMVLLCRNLIATVLAFLSVRPRALFDDINFQRLVDRAVTRIGRGPVGELFVPSTVSVSR